MPPGHSSARPRQSRSASFLHRGSSDVGQALQRVPVGFVDFNVDLIRHQLPFPVTISLSTNLPEGIAAMTGQRYTFSSNGLKVLLANTAIYLKGKSIDGTPVDLDEFREFLTHIERLLMSDPPTMSKREYDTYSSTHQSFLEALEKTEAGWDLVRFWWDSFHD